MFKTILRAGALPVCAAALLPTPATAQGGPPDAGERFYHGLYQEIGMGEPEKAIETYSRVTGQSEVAGKALFRRGICYEKMGMDDAALNCLSRAIANFPDTPEIRDKALEEKLRLTSQSMTDCVQEGERREERGDFEGAREMFRKALLIDPDNPSVQLQMASACRKLASQEKSLPRLEEAIRHYEDAAASRGFRSDLSVHRQLAECYTRTGQTEQAIKLWQTYLKGVDRENPDGTMAEFELELLCGASDYFQSRDLSPRLQDYLSEGDALTRNGDFSKAIRLYQQALREFPRSYLPPYRLAVLQELFYKKPIAAISFYRIALETAPQITAQRIRCKMAVLYYGTGDMESSIRYINQCISKDIRFVERELENKVRRIQAEKARIDKVKKQEEEKKRQQERLEKKRREEMRKRQILEQIRQMGKPAADQKE